MRTKPFFYGLRFRNIAELSAVQSAIVVPLIVYDRVIGTISLDNVTRKQAFTQKELEPLERFAGRAALLIENLQLIRQTRQRLRRLETCARKGKAAYSSGRAAP